MFVWHVYICLIKILKMAATLSASLKSPEYMNMQIFSCWTQDVVSSSVKSILRVCDLEASGLLLVMSPIMYRQYVSEWLQQPVWPKMSLFYNFLMPKIFLLEKSTVWILNICIFFRKLMAERKTWSNVFRVEKLIYRFYSANTCKVS